MATLIRELHVFDKEKLVFKDSIVPTKGIDLEKILYVTVSSAFQQKEWRIDSLEISRYRFTYTNAHGYAFVMTSDRAATKEKIEEAFMKVITEFVKICMDSKCNDEDTKEDFKDAFRRIAGRLPIKFCLAGHGGTGKTTLLELAILPTKGPPQKYVPTFFGDKAMLKSDFDPYVLSLFDLGGQDRFVQEWSKIIRASSGVIVVSDSTPANISWLRRVALPVLKANLPYSRAIALANKQDLPGALSPEEVERRLGIPAYPMIANRKENRDKWLKLLKDLLFENLRFIVIGDVPDE